MILKLLSIAPDAIKVATLAAGICLSGLAATASAAQFGVRVVDDAGMPVTGASVCFGLPGSYRQFGALFTDSDGQATADVPNIPFVVTVSKTRFSGVRISEPGRGFNLIKQVTLSEGTPGPRCKAGSTLADTNQSSINISQVAVSTDDQVTRITPIASGEPTEFRVSVTPEVESAKWTRLTDSIRLSRALASASEVYLQLRRFEGTRDGWLEARSETVTVFLPVASDPAL